MNKTKQLAAAFRKVADELDEVPDLIRVAGRECPRDSIGIHLSVDSPEGPGNMFYYADGCSLDESLNNLAMAIPSLIDGAKVYATRDMPPTCPRTECRAVEKPAHIVSNFEFEYLCDCGCRFMWAPGPLRWDLLYPKESNEQTNEKAR